MPHRSPVLALALGMLVLALASPSARAQETRPQEGKGTVRPPADFRVGVVDLASVFKLYKRSKDMEARLIEEGERLTKELDDLRKQINEISKELELLDERSQAFALKEEDRKIAVARFELKKDRRDNVIRKRREEYTLIILDDIEAVVKRYGEDQKFTLIFKVEGKPTEETRLLAGLKSVLYYSGEIDVTDAIVEILNRQFDLDPTMGRGSGAPKPPAAPAAPESPQDKGK